MLVFRLSTVCEPGPKGSGGPTSLAAVNALAAQQIDPADLLKSPRIQIDGCRIIVEGCSHRQPSIPAAVKRGENALCGKRIERQGSVATSKPSITKEAIDSASRCIQGTQWRVERSIWE